MRGLALHDPLVLALLAVLAAGYLAWLRLGLSGRAPGAPLPVLAAVRGERRSVRVRALALLPWLKGAALVLLVVAAARPRLGEERSLVRREGIAIQMVLDRSGSMEEAIRYGERTLPRVEVVKRIFEAFVRGGEGLPGRVTDLVGLTTFARFPEESCPLVSQKEPLIVAVRSLRTVAPFLTRERTPTFDQREAADQNPLNATAIGDGLMRAVLSLVTAEEDLRRARAQGGEDSAFRVKGKVAILLTDGQNNAGMAPLEAARFAKANGVRVYTILLLDRELRQQTLAGPRVVRERTDEEIDALMREPRDVAELTGGAAFFAAGGEELADVVKEIDRLEKTELSGIEYASYRELYSFPLFFGFLLLLVVVGVEETWLRVAP